MHGLVEPKAATEKQNAEDANEKNEGAAGHLIN